VLTFAASASAACEVTLSEQLSKTSCSGQFGCFDSNNSMYVRNGCRGVFTCNSNERVRCDPCDPHPCDDGSDRFAVCKCISAPAPPPAAKYMLLDDRNVISSDAKLVLGTVEKHPAGAMIKQERDYEMRFDNMQPNVWYDQQLKKWRAWYSAFTSCSKPMHEVPFCDNRPAQCGSFVNHSDNHASRGIGLLYAESDDGVAWVKPDLNMTDWKGSKANNLIELGGMTTGIYLDEAANSPSERYKVATGTNGKGGVVLSADGVHWGAVKDLEAETHGRWDTPKNIVWDPVNKQWIMYVRSAPTVDGLRIQSFTYSLTKDFMGEWAPAMPTGLNSSEQYQPDGFLVFPYEGIYLGIGNVFNPTQEDGAAAVRGQVNLVLGWSADARVWKWIKPNDSLIPLGGGGDFDACGVFAAKQDPLKTVFNDTMRLYYTGCNGPFFGSRGCSLGMATLQRDFFAGYRGGSVVTRPVRVAGRALKVSVEGGNTGVRVGIVGDSQFSLANCDPIKGKHTDVTVTWKGNWDLGKYLNGAVALEFSIPDDATAYAFSTGDSDSRAQTFVV